MRKQPKTRTGKNRGMKTSSEINKSLSPQQLKKREDRSANR